MSIITPKTRQKTEIKKVSVSYTPANAIKVTSLKQAKRLLSRLIYDLQTGVIDNQTAKDLTYLLISYANVFKQYEMENRIEEIEKKINESNRY